MPFDNSISMEPNATYVIVNSVELNRSFQEIVASFGVDSVHLVVHSKGGLDTRDYLARFHSNHEQDFSILSYTSLS
ncbi:hypothetical protein LCGC14_2737890, partial [marine sediment metagenome]